MPPIAHDNAAWKLYERLESARKLNDGLRVGDAWAQVLDIQKGDLGELLRVLHLLIGTYSAMKEQVGSLENTNHDLLTEHFPKIDQAFSVMNFDAPWNQVKQHLTDSALYSLRVCADALSRNGRDARLDFAELKKIRDRTEKLIALISSSNLDVRFKRLALEHLAILNRAISDYRITGIDGLIAATERTIGAIASRPDALSTIRSTDEGRAVWNVLKDIHNLGASSVNAYATTQYILRSLPDSDSLGALPLLPDSRSD